MSEPFLAEIHIFGFNFPPRGYAQCDGQVLPIAQNQALFSLIGTTYGGDGRTTFALPDLRGRAAVQSSSSVAIGAKQGEETHALTTPEMPVHRHAIMANSAAADQKTAAGHVLSNSGADAYVSGSPTLVSMNTATIGNVGTGQAHSNMQPYLTLNFAIAIAGVFPSRN